MHYTLQWKLSIWPKLTTCICFVCRPILHMYFSHWTLVSFKSYFSKVYHKYITSNPGCVITTASLVGFMIARFLWIPATHSKSDSSLPQDSSTGHEDSLSTTPAFTREEHARYQSRSEEGYDIHDPTKRKRKPALNSKTVILTDTDVLEGLKHKACEKVRESV
jgi:hypothetical protein